MSEAAAGLPGSGAAPGVGVEGFPGFGAASGVGVEGFPASPESFPSLLSAVPGAGAGGGIERSTHCTMRETLRLEGSMGLDGTRKD